MRYTHKTEYAFLCLLYLARAKTPRVSIHEIAKKERFPVAYLEKIFQRLRKAGLVAAHQGKGGGYSLSKAPGQITLRAIIEAIEGSTFDAFCEPEVRGGMVCNHFCVCALKPIWRKAKSILDDYFDSITLKTLSDKKL